MDAKTTKKISCKAITTKILSYDLFWFTAMRICTVIDYVMTIKNFLRVVKAA